MRWMPCERNGTWHCDGSSWPVGGVWCVFGSGICPAAKSRIMYSVCGPWTLWFYHHVHWLKCLICNDTGTYVNIECIEVWCIICFVDPKWHSDRHVGLLVLCCIWYLLLCVLKRESTWWYPEASVASCGLGKNNGATIVILLYIILLILYWRISNIRGDTTTSQIDFLQCLILCIVFKLFCLRSFDASWNGRCSEHITDISHLYHARIPAQKITKPPPQNAPKTGSSLLDPPSKFVILWRCWIIGK